jgi:SAM-dependent methyltransferase
VKSYVNTHLGPAGRFGEMLSLYSAHRSDPRGRVRQALKEARGFQATLEWCLERPLKDAAILEIGAGQQPILLTYFGVRNQAVGIDADVVPRKGRLADYVQMWRRNGSLRTLKTVIRKGLGVDANVRRELKEQLAAEELPSAPVFQMDASAMSFPDQSFDAIYSRAVFEHLSDPRSVLREVRRVLKPGGALVILFHLYTSDSGCHDSRILAGRRDHIPYWAHLRPKYRHTVRENTYLNRLRLAEWMEVFNSELPGCIVQPLNDAENLMRDALAPIRATGELSSYTDEELLTVTVEVAWANRQKTDKIRLPLPSFFEC